MATQQNKSPKRGKLPVEGASRTGAKYEVLRTSHLNGRVVNAGEVVEYDGVPGRYLKPINAEAEKAKGEADKIRSEREEAIVRTETVNTGAAANRKLRALDDERRGVDEASPVDEKPALAAGDRKELEAQAERTREQELERSQNAGGVTLQMTGTSPETVIPTTGPGAVANAEQLKSAEAQKADAKKK